MSANKAQFNLPMIAGIALALGLALWAGVILLEAWVNTRVAQEQEIKIVAPPMVELDAYKAEQQALLSEYRWTDQEAGVVQLPIERAMELVVQESGGGQR